jgi:hypothetical protein
MGGPFSPLMVTVESDGKAAEKGYKPEDLPECFSASVFGFEGELKRASILERGEMGPRIT